MTFFPFFQARTNLWNFWRVFGAVVSHLGSNRALCHKWACGCGAEVFFFRVFRGSSFDTVFASLKRELLKLPSLLFVFCSFLRFLLGFGVNATLHVFLGQLSLKPSFSFWFFLFVCLQKHCCPPENVFFVHFSVSPFLSRFSVPSRVIIWAKWKCGDAGPEHSDPTEIPHLSRDRCSNTPVALCFLWYRRLSLVHPHFFP